MRMRARSGPWHDLRAGSSRTGLAGFDADAHVELTFDLGASARARRRRQIPRSASMRGDRFGERGSIALIDQPAADTIVDELGNAGNAAC